MRVESGQVSHVRQAREGGVSETTYSYQNWGGSFSFLVCNTCGEVLLKDWQSNYRSMKPPKFCGNCGARIGKRAKVDGDEAIRLAKMARARQGQI